MKEIPLTQGQVALVDDEDFEFLNQWNWYARWDKTTLSYYAFRTEFPTRKTIVMSRLIMNTPKDLQCDHINHDTLNNQKRNLRNVTKSNNQMNRKGPRINTDLGILGVHRHGSGFRGDININKKSIHLPTRRTIEEAIADRKAAEEKYYEEYRNKDKH
jgi:hypothetical protein